MVRELEFELTEFTVSHIRFDSYANDVPAGGLYEISHDAYAYRGYHHRGEMTSLHQSRVKMQI